MEHPETFTAIMMTIGAVILICVMFLMVLLRAVARDRDALAGTEEAPARPVARPSVYIPEGIKQAPIGTLSLLMLYLMILVGLWGSIYILLIQRG